MDIDASINIGNEFPISAGSNYKSADPNKWTIMPKWESPILDFPSITRTTTVPATPVAYASASITVEDYTLIVASDTFSITTSTVTVNFEFDPGSSGPTRIDSTNYTIGYSSVTKNNELSAEIAAAINLALTNGEIDITPLQSDAVVNLIDNAGGSAINGNIPTNVIGTPIGTLPSVALTAIAFAGGADATPSIPASTTVGILKIFQPEKMRNMILFLL
jgi:hypothetical protein